MSVIILNMDEPKTCAKCRFFGFQGELMHDPVLFLGTQCDILGTFIGHDVREQEHYPYMSAAHALKENERWTECPIKPYKEEMK